MCPTTRTRSIQWDCDGDSSTSTSTSTCSNTFDSISSLSSLLDHDHEQEDERRHQHVENLPPNRNTFKESHAHPSSSSLVREILDRNYEYEYVYEYKPEKRQEAFECLRCLDDWSIADHHLEKEISAPHSKSSLGTQVQMQQKKNAKMIRRRISELRRGIFAGEREASVFL